jgi:hypothetical protein
MLINAIEGIVENGAIRLREDVSLPENTRVFVIVADPNELAAVHIHSPRLAHPEQYKDFRKQVVKETSADAGL